MPRYYNTLQEQLFGEAATVAIGAGKSTLAPPKRTPSGYEPRTKWCYTVPSHVTHLDVSWNTFDERYRVVVPDHVKWLDVSHTNYYHGVGFHVPDTLETLIHRGGYYPCIYKLPPALKVLDLSEQRIEWLPKLPKTLEVLKLTNCYSLKELPDLPSTLRVLDIQNCKKLRTLPPLPDTLKELWAGGCDRLPHELGSQFVAELVAENARYHQKAESRERQQKRCRALRQEIVAAAYHPRRVERWLELKGWDVLEEMLG